MSIIQNETFLEKMSLHHIHVQKAYYNSIEIMESELVNMIQYSCKDSNV